MKTIRISTAAKCLLMNLFTAPVRAGAVGEEVLIKYGLARPAKIAGLIEITDEGFVWVLTHREIDRDIARWFASR